MAKLTEQQIKEQIDRIIVLVDTRERRCSHITDLFDKYGVNWEKRKLNSDFPFQQFRWEDIHLHHKQVG